MKRKLAILLMISVILLISGCSLIKPDQLNEKVKAMLDRTVARDANGMYELLYPDTTDKKDYRALAKSVFEYFPIEEGYTMKLQKYDRYVGINNSDRWETGQYLIQTGGADYVILVKWYSDENGSGFSVFNVLNEEDWNAYLQEKSTVDPSTSS